MCYIQTGVNTSISVLCNVLHSRLRWYIKNDFFGNRSESGSTGRVLGSSETLCFLIKDIRKIDRFGPSVAVEEA